MEESFLACLSIEWLNTSYTIAYTMAAASTAVVLVCLVVEVRRKKFSWLVVYAPLLLVQPAWRLAWGEIIHHGSRAMSSDCGFGNRGESIFLTAVLVAILVVLVRGEVTKRLFFLRLTIVCAIILAMVFVLSYTSFPFAVLSGEMWGTIEGGAGRLSIYIVVFTLICALLYTLERLRRRTQRRATERVNLGGH